MPTIKTRRLCHICRKKKIIDKFVIFKSKRLCMNCVKDIQNIQVFPALGTPEPILINKPKIIKEVNNG